MRGDYSGVTVYDLTRSPNGPVIEYRIEDLPEEKQKWLASLPVMKKKEKPKGMK